MSNSYNNSLKHINTSFNNNIQKELNPDYVLFDTRPGDSSISIMALQKFADISVLCFNLNAWNFHLIKDFYDRMVKNDWYEKYDKKLMPKIVLVVTPVPRYANQFEVFNRRFNDIAANMNQAINSGGTKEIDPIVIPFNEQMATQDTLIRDDSTLIDDPTTSGYIKLAELLISQNPKDIENKIKKAEEGKTYNKVIEEFNLLTRNYSHKIEVFHSYGKYLSKMGKYKDAKDFLEKAVVKADKDSNMVGNNRKIYAGYSRLNFLLGNVYHNLGKIENAYNCFIKAFDHDPNNHRARAMIGDMLLELGDVKKDRSDMLTAYKKAENIYRESIEMSKEPDYYNRLGVAYTKLASCIDEIDKYTDTLKKANREFLMQGKVKQVN